MICSTPAFVLKTYDVRETSRMAIFFTRDFGKVKGILKGIRRDPKKFGSTLQLLSLNHIIFYRKRFTDVHLVSQCDLIDDFALWKGELVKFAHANFLSELVDYLLPAEDASPRIFELIFEFLNSLKDSRADARHFFQIKLLSLSGFKPHFDSCVVCDAKIAHQAYFSHVKGGLLCSRCLYQDQQAENISQGTIATILYIERSSWQSCLRLNMLPALRRQLDKILDCFIEYHVGRKLKTGTLLHEFLDR